MSGVSSTPTRVGGPGGLGSLQVVPTPHSRPQTPLPTCSQAGRRATLPHPQPRSAGSLWAGCSGCPHPQPKRPETAPSQTAPHHTTVDPNCRRPARLPGSCSFLRCCGCRPRTLCSYPAGSASEAGCGNGVSEGGKAGRTASLSVREAGPTGRGGRAPPPVPVLGARGTPEVGGLRYHTAPGAPDPGSQTRPRCPGWLARPRTGQDDPPDQAGGGARAAAPCPPPPARLSVSTHLSQCELLELLRPDSCWASSSIFSMSPLYMEAEAGALLASPLLLKCSSTHEPGGQWGAREPAACALPSWGAEPLPGQARGQEGPLGACCSALNVGTSGVSKELERLTVF